MYTDIFTDMCIDRVIRMCISMRLDMCIHMSIYKCAIVCIDVPARSMKIWV